MSFNQDLFSLLNRLAYPEQYTDTDKWSSGDGDAEIYFCKLSEEAKMLIQTNSA